MHLIENRPDSKCANINEIGGSAARRYQEGGSHEAAMNLLLNSRGTSSYSKSDNQTGRFALGSMYSTEANICVVGSILGMNGP